jgi:hypothetical protein
MWKKSFFSGVAIAAVFAVALPAWSQSSTTQDHNHGGGLTALFANVPAR